jgi:hypothetical protein
MVAPQYKELSEQNPGIKFLKVNADDDWVEALEGADEQFKADALPTFRFYKVR